MTATLIRALAAAAALASAAVHLELSISSGYGIHSFLDAAFMLNTIAGVVIAGLLVFWRHWLPLLLIVGFGASTLGGFFIFAGALAGALAWTALVAEVVAIVAGLSAAFREGYLSRGHRGRHSSPEISG